MSSKNNHEENWLRSIIKNGKWYLLGSISTKAISFLMLPVYTRYLDPEEYGIIGNINAIGAFLPFLISLSLDSALARFYHDYKGNKEKLRDLFSSVYWFIFLYGSVVTLVFISSAGLWFEDFLEISIFPYVFLTFIPPLLMQLAGLGIIFLKQSLNSKEVSIVEIGTSILNLAITVILLVFYDMGVLGRLLGGFVPTILSFVFISWYFINKGLLQWQFKSKLFNRALQYSLPLIPGAASSWIANLSDRLIITKYIDLAATGIYSLAVNIGFLLYAFQDAITQIIGPISLSGLLTDKENTKRKIEVYAESIWGIMLLACLGLSLFSQEIVLIFANNSYAEAYTMIPIIAFVYVLSSQYRMWGITISFHKRTKISMYAAILMAASNISLNFIFIPRYGSIAAAYTTLIATLIYTIFVIYQSLKLEKFDISYRKYAILFICFSIIILIQRQPIFEHITIRNFIVKGLLFIAFIFVTIFILKGSFKKLKLI